VTLVSVVLVTLDAAATVRRALESVRAQAGASMELVVVDGGSRDGTLDIVRELCPQARSISEPDRGIYDAMNKGISLAGGEWIYFLGADDALHSPDTLRRLEPHLNDPRLDVVYGDVIFEQGGRRSVYDGRFGWRKLYLKNACHQSMFYRRRVFDRVGLFDLRYRWVADHALNFRVFGDRTLRKRYVDEIVADYNADGASFTFPDLPFAEDRDRLFREAFGPARLWAAKALARARHLVARRPGAAAGQARS
jgi:glycosyltransferase involved in cell wall biosynthesis